MWLGLAVAWLGWAGLPLTPESTIFIEYKNIPPYVFPGIKLFPLTFSLISAEQALGTRSFIAFRKSRFSRKGRGQQPQSISQKQLFTEGARTAATEHFCTADAPDGKCTMATGKGLAWLGRAAPDP